MLVYLKQKLSFQPLSYLPNIKLELIFSDLVDKMQVTHGLFMDRERQQVCQEADYRHLDALATCVYIQECQTQKNKGQIFNL